MNGVDNNGSHQKCQIENRFIIRGLQEKVIMFWTVWFRFHGGLGFEGLVDWGQY